MIKMMFGFSDSLLFIKEHEERNTVGMSNLDIVFIRRANDY